jgi:hypothetical protein
MMTMFVGARYNCNEGKIQVALSAKKWIAVENIFIELINLSRQLNDRDNPDSAISDKFLDKCLKKAGTPEGRAFYECANDYSRKMEQWEFGTAKQLILFSHKLIKDLNNPEIISENDKTEIWENFPGLYNRFIKDTLLPEVDINAPWKENPWTEEEWEEAKYFSCKNSSHRDGYIQHFYAAYDALQEQNKTSVSELT